MFPFKKKRESEKKNPSCFFPNSSPCVSKAHMHTECSSAPPSLSGSWRMVSLLRILALLHHNTHDVSAFHTHFPPLGDYQNLSDVNATPPKRSTVLRAVCSRPLGARRRQQTCSQLALRSPLHFSLCQLILKIAGNSIFILLSKNFFLSNTAPLPNCRTSRGVPAPSSRSFWVAAVMGGKVLRVIIRFIKISSGDFKRTETNTSGSNTSTASREASLSTADCLPPSPPPPSPGSENGIKMEKLHPVTNPYTF